MAEDNYSGSIHVAGPERPEYGETYVVRGERLVLSPLRAVYWESVQTLLVADPHFGKAATFRASSIAIPRGTTTSDLGRLERLITSTGARRITFLGDLLHARNGRAGETIRHFSEWRSRFADLELMLVRGNHDLNAGDPPAEWGIQCVNEPWYEEPFVFRHHPVSDAHGYVLAGHYHPAVALTGAGRQSERLPCFHFGRNSGLLPAFGSFTGYARVSPIEGDDVFAIADGQVIRCC